MRVITSNPIIEEKDFHENEWFSNASAAFRKAKRQKRKADRAKKGTFLQRVSTGVQNLRQSGILDSLGTLGQQNVGGVGDFGGMDMGGMPPPPPPPPPPPTREGMSTGAKVAIGVVIASVVGVGVYFLVKKLNAKKGK
jgi:hypothetical protein